MTHSANATAAVATPAKTASGLGMMVAAAGIVYGDIGTSPLYSLKEIFSPSYGLVIGNDSVLGVLSLIFWSITLVVTVKYVMFILRADNGGEGGVMALTALAQRAAAGRTRLRAGLILLGLFGAALFYGDSLLTPAVSVLSAVEGIELVYEGVEAWTLPIALVILLGLFAFQKHGTARIGACFGPVMVLWFLTLAALGLSGIAARPEVLQALNPWWALKFFSVDPLLAVTVLGAVVLTITGAEALYADLGHFGRPAIVRAWLFLAFPCLILNYFGQGALLLADPSSVRNPFYLLAPSWGLAPLVVLSTVATVIASQAVITGAFSITRQAIQLGYLPRMQIRHTSKNEQGQIYIPVMNTLLMVGVLVLVAVFQSSSALAGAYGIAVTGTMLTTTVLVSAVVLLLWRWPPLLVAPLLLLFIAVDTLFFAANAPKLLGGGAVPLVIGVLIFILMSTWKRGRALVQQRLQADALSVEAFMTSTRLDAPQRVSGTAVFLTGRVNTIPHALLHNLLHNKVLHQQVILLTVRYHDVPRVAEGERLVSRGFGNGFHQVELNYGFADEPDIPAALARHAPQQWALEAMDTTYFLSRETVIASSRLGMALWRERLFAGMQRNASTSMGFFNLPANRVVELGAQVEI